MLGTGNMFSYITHDSANMFSQVWHWLHVFLHTTCPTSLPTLVITLPVCFIKRGFFLQARYLIKRSMDIMRLVGDAVIALRVPDEEMISIETTFVTLTLGRHSPHKLVGLNIEAKDARFVLPPEKEALESSGIRRASFVDTQVRILHRVPAGAIIGSPIMAPGTR